MADRPILFSGPMVRALLDDRKTQTRRVIADRNIRIGCASEEMESLKLDGWDGFEANGEMIAVRLPYAAGDRLWVRETWALKGERDPMYAADWRQSAVDGLRPWRPSIFMPRWASRLTLILTEVHVQRLKDITAEDAIAEGASSRPQCSGFRQREDGWSMDWSRVGETSRWASNGRSLSVADVALDSAVNAFGSFINELHDPRWNLKGDGIFGANPWVVALTFTVHPENIDALAQPAAGETSHVR
ncbi:MAG: hypothetical protein DI629_12340 [Mesorhizobium amorphae]|nr:MAG: hypothetical protein DI629_12340 [Mesorhizobium amorphae]